MHVFTYGTLMFPEVWRAVVGRDYETVSGVAAGFEVMKVAHAAFPGIIEAASDTRTPGIVYLEVAAESLARLDLFEDDFYERRIVRVDCVDGQCREAAAYVVPPHNGGVLSDQRWDRDRFVESGGLQQFIERFQGFARVNSTP